MAGNIAVVGVVINLNSADAAQTFAPTIGHQAALVQGFGYDEQAALLKAKSLLMSVRSPFLVLFFTYSAQSRSRCNRSS